MGKSVKEQTLELYDQLPQEKNARMSRTDIRDKVFELNYKFFGFIASHTFINNSSITYEDKFQSACMHFCECWWWYKWKGDIDQGGTHKGYRQDLSFGVFFKPRIGEMIERELNEVKYSIRRSLCMEAGKQLGKHWGQVKYEDLANVHLPPDKMTSLKSIFGTLYWADLADHELYIPAEEPTRISEFDRLSDKYNDIESLLIHEMIEEESKLDDKYLQHMSEMYGIPYIKLLQMRPIAEKDLYEKLHSKLEELE